MLSICMRRKSIFITVLINLLIFQSLWNVAAAFCQHENLSATSIVKNHFGHHQTIDSCSDVLSTIANVDHTDTTQLLFADDHHDHLPSYNVMSLTEVPNPITDFKALEINTKSVFFWYNFYHSPDLIELNPPPILAPL